MFTGIVTDIGKVRAIAHGGDTRLEIETTYDVAQIDIGASICCSGACLTVVDKAPGWFAVDVSGETMTQTNLRTWAVGARVNLERALKVGDELGGHIVTGHVDCTAEIVELYDDGDSKRFRFRVPDDMARYIASKGSVALNGVSLTVNEVEDNCFGVNIIPHTQAQTTFGNAAVGDRVNVEVDVLARYVARLNERDKA